MFPSSTTGRQSPRSLRELVRGAVGTALEFVTLGEARLADGAPSRGRERQAEGTATLPLAPTRAAPAARQGRRLAHGAEAPAHEPAERGEVTRTAPSPGEHPHRRPLARRARPRRPGTIRPGAQVCTTPVHPPAPRR